MQILRVDRLIIWALSKERIALCAALPIILIRLLPEIDTLTSDTSVFGLIAFLTWLVLPIYIMSFIFRFFLIGDDYGTLEVVTDINIKYLTLVSLVDKFIFYLRYSIGTILIVNTVLLVINFIPDDGRDCIQQGLYGCEEYVYRDPEDIREPISFIDWITGDYFMQINLLLLIYIILRFRILYLYRFSVSLRT